MAQISIDQFKQVEMRVGLVVEASEVEKSTKLIKLIVDFGLDDKRVIFTAVRLFGYTPEYFLNKKFIFVTNLEYKKITGEESRGMILAVGEEKPIFVIPAEEVVVGSKVR
ncbi:hypothetical protein A2634_02025 [Candidatus Amesbacteria bacterium RIFCSPHIGHO2_01_FULL_48_32]|uniref:tRNA-binding domain-containing protein n=1 Tax=Candidatus Amesbacteria bacterium RIFCSPLOWO2_01_FULL_48_25 TaxID=1797259 RepID=A0A1F4ZFF8_9BACT|nr:MAG: hypothetical protein A2634_02025 [Candidatus Amesbacteria bacterium RIFCSPHIGHO2_01_FULL_48_32]OGD04367.1 MAG: hypothetical protein A2989_05025 [Candidatus Amesbacteria bacterium RIFCSPLOWO2_01_FULL_48_25]HJZ06203.1 methionine--tRNA ligase [Patescibacteria group bacterium]